MDDVSFSLCRRRNGTFVLGSLSLQYCHRRRLFTLDILAFDEKEGSPRGGALGSPYPSEAGLEGPDGVPRSTVVEISLSGDK